jgi:hypothetical protein
MSHALISPNADLKRLRDEGYFIQIRGGLLLMREIPYVDPQRQIRRGTLISSLTLAGDKTKTPDTHTVHFDGEVPCRANGEPLHSILNQSGTFDLGQGLVARHLFSSKPPNGYADYYEKMSTYATILAGQATSLDPGVSPRVFRAPEDEDDSVFNYVETASDRAGIGALSDQLRGERVGIIGLGGTGSYILDLVAKTPVREIRLFDDDEFLQHNAFRAPGAPSIEELREAKHKVEYLHGIYSRMHRGITAHPTRLHEGTMGLLDGLTFCFLCLDSGKAKRQIVEKLEAIGASFIDVGMGLELDEGSLGGILRVTSSTPERREAFHNGRVPLGDGGDRGLYSSNIQVADLNSLNASLAVIKWKKLRGFYRDLEKEIHCTYTTDGNMLDNGVR